MTGFKCLFQFTNKTILQSVDVLYQLHVQGDIKVGDRSMVSNIQPKDIEVSFLDYLKE